MFLCCNIALVLNTWIELLVCSHYSATKLNEWNILPKQKEYDQFL